GDAAVLVLLRQLPRGADDVLKERGQVHRLRAKLELAGLDLGQIKHLVDEAEQMGTRTVDPAQRLQRLFRGEARRIADHHLGQPDDGVERGAQLVAHAGDELRLVLARHLELTALFLDFREQIGVLDGQHGLRREGPQQSTLCWGNSPGAFRRTTSMPVRPSGPSSGTISAARYPARSRMFSTGDGAASLRSGVCTGARCAAASAIVFSLRSTPCRLSSAISSSLMPCEARRWSPCVAGSTT